MKTSDAEAGFEAQIAQWREFILKRRGVVTADADELESHLRDQAADLMASGLSPDEAFLVAVKRLGAQDEISREFARVHSGRLWKQLVLAGADAPGPAAGANESRTELRWVIGLAVLAAASFKVPALFGVSQMDNPDFFARNAALFFLPSLAAYLAWKRRASGRTIGVLVGAFIAGGIFANAYPFHSGGQTELLSGLHLPMALWLVTGIAYVGGDWRSHSRRMDFIRFTGEWVIYMSLIALGGGVLAGITAGAFGLFGVDTTAFIVEWLVPCGAMGAAIVAAWLVEAKQGVIENLAPVLTKIFTPLVAALLIALVVTIPITWTGKPIDRNALIVLDLLLALVLGLVLYAISARDASEAPGLFDRLQFVLVLAALVVDAFVLAGLLGRIGEYGFTANRVAALGENLILLVNLAWATWLALGFLRHRRTLGATERWQTSYVPVYLAWAVAVVALFPPIFSFA
ncbi:MAG TPA: permease prefix domain 1-containing protein [Demequinaceae bacterium]